ncbi:MAG: iron ABC transporter permease [Devosiaceae bacterium]|nr:iron ABC transporter permease [Devosiaceae bacterium]
MSANNKKEHLQTDKSRPFSGSSSTPHQGNWLVPGAAAMALIVGMPIIALIVMSLSGDTASLAHLGKTVLTRASLTTGMLLVGLVIFTGSIGAISAWLVSFFEFPGRRVFVWALMLPLAVPTYISAYAFTEFFTFTGPVQTLVRDIGGFSSARDYWFPDIRSLPGAIFVLSMVLYPYVYLSVRALFFVQGRRAIEAGLLLGANQRRILTKILLPLARPALALGVILAMMEAINDIGAMEYLGVQTLTFSIFSIWVHQGDMAGAAQLALILLFLVLALILAERWARKGQSFVETGSGSTMAFERMRLRGPKAALAMVACLIPVGLGFGVPVIILGTYAGRYLQTGFDSALLNALLTSVSLAGIAALIAVLLALFLSYAVRVRATKPIGFLVRFASTGYAMPGTIIALGIFLPIAMFDNFVDSQMRQWFNISTGLLITGSGATLVYAYVVRFMAVAEGSIDASFKKISSNLDSAARCFGYSQLQVFTRILLPLMRPAIATAGLLVFIESLKELSATLMLRPFGIETISIYIHDLASRGKIEQAGIGSLLLILVGIIPVIILSRTTLKDR